MGQYDHSDDLDADFRSLADEARRVEPRVNAVSTRVENYKTVLVIELTNATREQQEALADALRAHRRRHDLVAEFLIVNTTGGGWVSPPDVPTGWAW